MPKRFVAGTTSWVDTAAAKVPLDGMELWLDAASAESVQLDSNGEVARWLSRAECPALRHLRRPSGAAAPRIHDAAAFRALEFDYNRSMDIEPPLSQTQTVISVHKFKDLADRRPHGGAQFYIITGSSQGPFHGAGGHTKGACITSGDGKWAGAGGEPFYNGTIRLDGVQSAVKEQMVWKDTLRIASVSCTHPVPYGVDSPGERGTNRIGRDRDYHEFAGLIAELLVYSRALSPDEIDRVERYLRAKHKCACCGRLWLGRPLCPDCCMAFAMSVRLSSSSALRRVPVQTVSHIVLSLMHVA